MNTCLKSSLKLLKPTNSLSCVFKHLSDEGRFVSVLAFFPPIFVVLLPLFLLVDACLIVGFMYFADMGKEEREWANYRQSIRNLNAGERRAILNAIDDDLAGW